MWRKRKGTRRFCAWFGGILIAAGFSGVAAEQADGFRVEMDLSGIPWKLWMDEKAQWTNDELFLPPVDLSKVPEQPPTGGWAALDRVNALSVNIPGTVEEYLGKGNGATGDVTGVSWWFCDVTVPEAVGTKRLLLRFESARLRAEVYVNRKLAAYDIIGNTPFEADISKLVKPGDPCRIAVRITDSGGGFDWRDSNPDVWGKYRFPASHGFGGVTGKVRLLLVDPVYVSDIYVRNQPSICDVGVQVTVQNTEARPVKARLVAEVVEKADPSKILVSVESEDTDFACGDTLVELPVSAPKARLWQLDAPNLYRCRVKVIREGSTLDQDERVFGFRWFTPEGIGKDARFRLNGRRIVLLSAISWGFWPCNGMFPTPELAEKEVRTAKKLGLNMLNFHRTIGQPIVLDKADELGLLFYEEPGGYASARDDAFAQAIAREKLLRMVKRDRSHPALIIYNMINEAWATGGMETNQAVQQARQRDMQAAHAVDPSRCIVYTSAWSDFKEGMEERSRLHMRPYDSTCWFSGWFDRHFATGPECYLESFYGGPTNIYHSFPNRSEIVFLGEEGAISAPDRLALIKRDLAKSKHTGWDGKIYGEWIQTVERFMSDKHLRPYFPDLDEFTKSLGHISHYYQGRIIEGFRIGNTGDGYVVNGWESEVMENHSGIVDCYRNPKADPSVMAWYNQPLYIAVKLRNKIAKSPDRIIADLYIVNEKDVKGAHALAVALKNPAGQVVFQTRFPVSPTGGELYGELLKEGLELPVTQGGGLYKVEAALRDPSGKVVALGRDEIFAVDFEPNRISGKGAVLDASGVIARVLKTEKNVDIPAYGNHKGRLDWIVVADPPGGAPRAVPPSCFRLPAGDGEGLRTVFFNRSDFKDQVHSRTDKTIDFTCVEGAPADPALGVMTGYEIRWEGKLVAPASGDYTFALQHDRNARLWIGGTQVIDDWRADRFVQGATARVRLEAGKPADFRLDYSHVNDCPALIKLMWVPPGAPAIDTVALLRRLKDEGSTVIVVDAVDQWAPVLEAAGAVNYGGKFNIGKYWAGGQYFVREHPLFKGLPVNGAMDWPYQSLIRYDKHRFGLNLSGEEVVVGCYQSMPFQVGTAVGVVPYGKGRIVLSTLQVCSNLENQDRASQVAKKLLLNYVEYAGETRSVAYTNERHHE